MKQCPNPECAYRRRHQRPAEYQDTATSCSDCNGPLEPAPLVADGKPAAAVPAPWSRLGVMLACAGTYVAACYQLLPGTERLVEGLGRFASAAQSLSVVSLGFTPAISAYMLVELAAILVPAWRPLRISGRARRAALRRWAIGLSALLAFVQAVGISFYLQNLGQGPEMSHLALPSWVPWAALFILPLGTLLFAVLAAINDRWGLGDGVSVLLLASLVPDALTLMATSQGSDSVGESDPTKSVILLALASAAAWVTARASRRLPPFGAPGQPYAIEVPPSGLAPLLAPASFLVLLRTLGAWFPGLDLDLARLGLPTSLLEMALAVSLSVGLGFLYNQPRRVAEVWFGPDARESQRGIARGRVVAAVGRGALFVLAFEALQLLSTTVNLPFVLSLVVVIAPTAIVLDLMGEWSFRRRHAQVVGAWPIHRVYAVAPALEALAKNGIPAYPRGLHHRTLLQFFGAYVPVELLVPGGDAERAERIVRERLFPPR